LHRSSTRDKHNENSGISDSVSRQQRCRTISTYVAPARINSIVFDFVNQERIRRYEIVDSITTTILTEIVLIRLHIMTGIIRRSVTKNNSNAFAIRWIKGPLYIYIVGSEEMS
jgi:hypothetical protein